MIRMDERAAFKKETKGVLTMSFTPLDVSCGGARILSSQPIQEGAEIQSIELRLPNSPAPFICAAIVSWCRPSKQYDGFEVGLTFVGVEEADAERIHACLEALEAMSS